MTATKTTNPLRALLEHGQSVWLDYIRRTLVTSGELKRLVAEDGLRGMTSNPAIFEKAISGSKDYDDILTSAEARKLDASAVFERIAVRDIRDAADILRPVFDEANGHDGHVSLEVSPTLAHNTAGTLEEARRLWKAVDRPNLMIKVPATPEGIPAIEQLQSEGINVNVTLLFAQEMYAKVLEAFLRGLDKRRAAGGNVSKIASVASFFVSRIDTLIDGEIEQRLKKASGAEAEKLNGLLGQIAIANAKLAYQHYLHVLATDERWKALKAAGARPQRLLWASTSTKNPQYRDVIYVETLIGPDTVNTMPPQTFEAFREHGEVRTTLTEDIDDARRVLATLNEVGISLSDATAKLLDEGVKSFADAFEKLLGAIRSQCQTSAARADSHAQHLPGKLADAVQASLADWKKNDKVRQLWARDAKLWTGADESKWLGWLGIVEEQRNTIDHLTAFAADVRKAGFEHLLLLGMGGSSLCPEVLAETFGRQPGFPKLHVLDSTDPAQVASFDKKVDLERTLCIVSSKSGSTLEPNIFKQYFFDRMKQTVGADRAGQHFVAITDPGSHLQKVAEKDRFRHIFYGLPSIGGRYSALSDFGMVPAAAMGLDVGKFLDRTDDMVHACAASVPIEQNPGVVLGTILGVAAQHGMDKVTIITSPKIHDLGAWLEQLLAESTGKVGKGLIPVDRERLAAPDAYSEDRVFVYVRLDSAPDAKQDAGVEALRKTGRPVVQLAMADAYDLGAEFFRWEIATAVAGAILGINAFNQPDVEASKVETRKLTDAYEKTGKLPSEAPIASDGPLKLFTDEKNAAALKQAAGGDSVAALLKAHLARIKPNDYFAVLAYIEMNAAHEERLQQLRHLVRDKQGVATCLGFGPRFLHSTGQAYKGGPNSGVFLQLTCDDAHDVPVPDQSYTFGTVKAAQARGDFAVLAERDRRALRVHLSSDVAAALGKLVDLVKQALA